jgi:hypothetical protein
VVLVCTTTSNCLTSVIFKQFESDLSDALASAPKWSNVDITTFATNGPLGDIEESSDEKSIEETAPEFKSKVIVSSSGRPDVSRAITAAALAVGPGRLAVAGKRTSFMLGILTDVF